MLIIYKRAVLAVYSVLHSNSCRLVVICFHVFSLFSRAEQMPGPLLQWSSYQPPFLPSWPQIKLERNGLYSTTLSTSKIPKAPRPWWQRCCSNAPLDRVEPWRQSATNHQVILDNVSDGMSRERVLRKWPWKHWRFHSWCILGPAYSFIWDWLRLTQNKIL